MEKYMVDLLSSLDSHIKDICEREESDGHYIYNILDQVTLYDVMRNAENLGFWKKYAAKIDSSMTNPLPGADSMLIPQVRQARKYPNSPWETIHSPGEIMQYVRDLTRSTRMGVPSHSQPLINTKYQIQVTDYL
jgi:hypothetical protein